MILISCVDQTEKTIPFSYVNNIVSWCLFIFQLSLFVHLDFCPLIRKEAVWNIDFCIVYKLQRKDNLDGESDSCASVMHKSSLLFLELNIMKFSCSQLLTAIKIVGSVFVWESISLYFECLECSVVPVLFQLSVFNCINTNDLGSSVLSEQHIWHDCMQCLCSCFFLGGVGQSSLLIVTWCNNNYTETSVFEWQCWTIELAPKSHSLPLK